MTVYDTAQDGPGTTETPGERIRIIWFWAEVKAEAGGGDGGGYGGGGDGGGGDGGGGDGGDSKQRCEHEHETVRTAAMSSHAGRRPWTNVKLGYLAC